jgi:hypothetical protein
VFNAAEEPWPEGVKLCPVMSRLNRTVLCFKSNCYAAYPVRAMSETIWYCAIIDGPNKYRNPSSRIIEG